MQATSPLITHLQPDNSDTDLWENFLSLTHVQGIHGAVHSSNVNVRGNLFLNQKNPVLYWCCPITLKKNPPVLRHSVKKPEMEYSEKATYFRKKKKSLKLQKEEIFLTLNFTVSRSVQPHTRGMLSTDVIGQCAMLCVRVRVFSCMCLLKTFGSFILIYLFFQIYRFATILKRNGVLNEGSNSKRLHL